MENKFDIYSKDCSFSIFANKPTVVEKKDVIKHIPESTCSISMFETKKLLTENVYTLLDNIENSIGTAKFIKQ